MPRRARIEGAGLIHHVTGHSLSEVDAFPDGAARRGFLSLLAKTTVAFRWHVLAYCLLPNDHHLLIETEEPNLGAGMRRLHGLHAAHLNGRLGRNGHLWRDRFHSRVVDSDRYVVQAAIYIDSNPVEANLCSSAAEWRWSSYPRQRRHRRTSSLASLWTGSMPTWARRPRMRLPSTARLSSSRVASWRRADDSPGD